jgi:hypothetical protein
MSYERRRILASEENRVFSIYIYIYIYNIIYIYIILYMHPEKRTCSVYDDVTLCMMM